MTKPSKPIVTMHSWRYIYVYGDKRLLGTPLDHPGHGGLVTNTQPVITSTVVDDFVAGPEHQRFIETRNTIYAVQGPSLDASDVPPTCRDCHD